MSLDDEGVGLCAECLTEQVLSEEGTTSVLRLLCPMCREVVVITPDAPGICPCGFVIAEVGESKDYGDEA